MTEEHANNDGNELNILLDSTYPLLQKFRELCPGTFKHSQALVSMMESISMALDLDVTFMKVAAQYHDIGKINNAKFFTENQMEDDPDPHENLDPYMSYQIISKHVSDGVNILINDENFPRKIIEIISHHHGTSIIKYFFDKSDTDIEDLYRYKCSKPECIEAAALMLGDHIEAKSRSLMQAGKFNPKETIEGTVNSLLNDGQLDSVYMKLGDLKKIKEALAKELEGIYQRRVDYDEAKTEKKNKKDSKKEKE